MTENTVKVLIKRLPGSEGLPGPAYATPGSACFDATSAVEGVIPPGQTAKIPLGFSMAFDPGYAALVFARSGLAAKNGLAMANGVGVIDSDYRGECCALLRNASEEPFKVTRGMRVCQIALVPTPRVQFVGADELDDTERGTGGFGSTGTR